MAISHHEDNFLEPAMPHFSTSYPRKWSGDRGNSNQYLPVSLHLRSMVFRFTVFF